jgi:hypothetical protein
MTPFQIVFGMNNNLGLNGLIDGVDEDYNASTTVAASTTETASNSENETENEASYVEMTATEDVTPKDTSFACASKKTSNFTRNYGQTT